MKYLILLITLITLLPTQSFSQCIVSHTGGDIGTAPAEWGQSFTATCSGAVNYVGFIAWNGGVVPSDTLYIFDGSTVSGTPIYSQIFSDITVANNGDTLRVNLTGIVPLINGNQYTFEFNPGPITLKASQDYLGGNGFFNGVDANIDVDFVVSISPLVGLEDFKQTILSVYPNPTTNNITISFDEEQEYCKVSLRNSLGQLLFIDKYKSTNQLELDLSSFPAGIYFLQFEVNNEIVNKKIIKE